MDKKEINFEVNNSNAINKKQVRSSNIELLRIVLCGFVITIHYLIPATKFFLLAGAVDCFAIISGYFLCKNKDDLRFVKFIGTIIFLYFFNIILVVTFNYATPLQLIDNSDKWHTWSLIFEMGWGSWWYIWGILIVYLFSPFFNYGLEKLGAKKAGVLIFFIWFICQLSGLLKNSYSAFSYNYDSIAVLIYSYLLGGFLRIYGQNFLNNKKIILISGSIFFCICILFQCLYNYVYPTANIWFAFSGGNASLFSLPIAFYLFAFFNLIKIKNYNFLNFIGGTSLLIYAYHQQGLYFATVINYSLHIDNTNLNNRLVALLFTLFVSVVLYWPFKKYSEYFKIFVNKVQMSLSNRFSKKQNSV